MKTTMLYIIELENIHNPFIRTTAVGYNTAQHAIDFCRIDLNHWKILTVKTRKV